MNILRVWYYELTTAGRDRGVLIFILFVPLAYPLLYSYVYTNEVVREIPAAVVDESGTPLSREFIRKLDATPDVNITHICHNSEEAQLLLKRQEVYGFVRIPSSFTEDITRGDQTSIGLYCDMSSMLYYKGLMLAATNVSLDMNSDIKVAQHLATSTDREEQITRTPIRYDYVPLFNPQSGFAAFLIPPVLMLIIQQTILLGIGMSVGDTRERFNGSPTPRQFHALHPLQVITGKTLFYFLLYLVLGIYMFTAVSRWFALPQFGDFVAFVAILIPFILATCFMALALSAFIYRREDCIMIFVFLSVPMLFLSGISWPGATMPTIWKVISYCFPSTFAMNGYVRIQSMGADLSDITFELVGLVIQMILWGLLAYRFFGGSYFRKTREKRTSTV